jgi:transcriptional regulator with XRE-family HTH domain
MTLLSQKLRELRETSGLTARAVAEHLGKSPGYISRVEGRGEIPSPELLCRFAALYGVPPEELLGLAKDRQLERAAEDIEARQQAALTLFRKGKK